MIKRKVMSQCSSIGYCNGWNDAVDEFSKNRYVPVKCISERKSFANNIIIGENYRIDKYSLRIYSDGNSFVDVYGFDYKFICHMNVNNMNHFVGISEV